jgi:hypothetical protein
LFQTTIYLSLISFECIRFHSALVVLKSHSSRIAFFPFVLLDCHILPISAVPKLYSS